MVISEPAVVLRSLGTAEIGTPVTTITPSQEIMFASSLYLILAGGKRTSRSQLASLLWPRATPKVAAHRLRQTILQLKKLGFAVLANRDTLYCKTTPQMDFANVVQATGEPERQGSSLKFLPGYD